MISKASSLVQKNFFVSNWKYVIIDEFQDISKGRTEFLNAILNQNSQTKLFAVGDDWQSIYGFNGSDIRFTFDFEKVFGKTSRVDLDKSFRFTQPILDVSSRFIQKNPLQLKKNITSKPSLHKKTVEIIENEFGNENYFYDLVYQKSFFSKLTLIRINLDLFKSEKDILKALENLDINKANYIIIESKYLSKNSLITSLFKKDNLTDAFDVELKNFLNEVGILFIYI